MVPSQKTADVNMLMWEGKGFWQGGMGGWVGIPTWKYTLQEIANGKRILFYWQIWYVTIVDFVREQPYHEDLQACGLICLSICVSISFLSHLLLLLLPFLSFPSSLSYFLVSCLCLFCKPLPPVSPASHAALSIYLHLFLLQSSAFSFLVFLFQPEISTLFPFICIFYPIFQSGNFFEGKTLTLHAALKYVFTAWQSKCGMMSLLKSVFFLYCMSVVNKPQSNQWTVSDIQIMAKIFPVWGCMACLCADTGVRFIF